ncbi:Gp19/Gp15/Gp42 family protein [Saxibacter everestensis]|uniref:Gp19/Gp15/Gp42 family protein n=1 Tax=Saxibacter everestensis TaxID=2909229 RepID=A0ABY8QUT6_9MICO|nr:Gp19/Gp15/Gp42 family protein [Brevibacteriaceae bacterium ZFBP1038]
MAWAEPGDVKARWIGGDPLPVTDQQLTTLIEDAEDVILGEFPTMNTLVPDTVPKNRVVRVIARMVIRVIRNPEGIRQVQETTGPYSQSETYGGDNPGELYLTDADRRDLSGRKTAGKAYTVSTVPGGWP